MRYFFCVIFAFSFSQKLSKFVVFTSNHFSKFFLFFWMDFGQKSQIWASWGQTMSRGWKASLSTMHVAPTVPMVGTCPTCGCAVLGSHQIIHGWFSSGPRPGGPFGPGWFWGGFSGRLGATPLCGSGWVATLKIREINFRVSLILNEIKNANRWDMQKLISLKIWLTGKLAINENK